MIVYGMVFNNIMFLYKMLIMQVKLNIVMYIVLWDLEIEGGYRIEIFLFI